MRVLVTCPPMLEMMDELRHHFDSAAIEVFCPTVSQTLAESELIELVPQFDGWIIGDDPATRRVFLAGRRGKLKAAVKWGIGTDNIDFTAAQELGIPITNTPRMFGREVADLAMAYVIGLARQTHLVHEQVKQGAWPKPAGISLADRTLGLIGFGDIGRNIAKRALTAEMNVIVYDPFYAPALNLNVMAAEWPQRINQCDFLVFACSLTAKNRHMLSERELTETKPDVRIVNVARGALIDESALARALESGHVHSVALDVFEVEPLPTDSPLRGYPRCIFGSHNASNTNDAVRKASQEAISIMLRYLRPG